MKQEAPVVLPYDGVSPKFASNPIYAGRGAAVLGRAAIGKAAWFGSRSVVRADGHYVEIGDNLRLGSRSTVHIAHGLLPTHIGNDVTIGVNSIIHACDVGDQCHIGSEVVILDGSKVSAYAAVADRSTLFPRTALEGGWLYEGRPAKPVRRLEPGELDALHARTRALADEADSLTPAPGQIEAAGHLFIAQTARVSGRLVAAPDVGIWFGCQLDAAAHLISVGESTNIQDNTIIRCIGGPVTIGRESTIGHNALMTDCQIGDGALVGIGAIVSPGVVIESDVLLAASAVTTQGQRLEQGWLYGGGPARRMSRLDDKKLAIIRDTWPVYSIYARKFAAVQREFARQ
jgi:gamma-carbonic anhydrase